MKCHYTSVVRNSQNKVLVSIAESNHEVDSAKTKLKFLSIENNNATIIDSFDTTLETQLKSWSDSTSSLIQILNDTIKCRFNSLDIAEAWEPIKYSLSKDDFIRFIDRKDSVLYAYMTEQIYEYNTLFKKSTHKSNKYTLLKFDFETSNFIEKSISDLLLYEISIADIKHIGNDEFIISALYKKKESGNLVYIKLEFNNKSKNLKK